MARYAWSAGYHNRLCERYGYLEVHKVGGVAPLADMALA